MSFLNRLFGGHPAASHPMIQPAEYKTRFVDGKQAHSLIDVRTAGEFRGGHLPGAVNISVQELNQRLNKIPRDKPVVVYCQSGSRSAQAAQALLQAGYADVYDLGGMSACVRQGMPVTRGA